MLKGFTRQFKPIDIISQEQVQAIHRGTLDVLETTGVRIEHERALEILADSGCQIDLKSHRARIPGYLVEECLRRCPSSFSVKARDPRNNLRLGGNTLYVANSVGMQIVDLDTWESRTATLKEQDEGVMILDALDNLHMIETYTPYMSLESVEPCMLLPVSMTSRIRNTSKGILGDYSNDSELFAIKMAKVVDIQFLCQFLASPPMTYYNEAIESMLRYVEAGFPLMLSGGATMGGSGPVTVAGSTITNNVQIMAGIVLAQMVRPGTGVIVSDFTFPMDMKTGQPVFGGLGAAQHSAVFAQVWRQYNIPVKIGSIGYSNSKKIDFQAAWEVCVPGLLAALAGANLIDLHGGLYAELTFSPVLSIIEDDVSGWIGRFLEGVQVNDETLAIDLIEKVGPIPGQYLNTSHTRNWWRREQFIPGVADHQPYPEWLKGGKKDTIALAKERMADILAKHQPTPLSSEQDKALDEILAEARSFYRQKGLI